MKKTFNTCTKVFFDLIRKNTSNCCTLALLFTLVSCGKGITEEDSGSDDGKDTQYLLSTEISLSKTKKSYTFPGGADLNLPKFIEYQGGNIVTSPKLIFSKGIENQEVNCYYDFKQEPQVYEFDACYLAAYPGDILKINAGERIYQDKDNVMELQLFDSDAKAQIEVDWFSK